MLSHLEMKPLRLRVRGVPGSGKTVVAERFYQRAIQEGRRPLLLCFNRPLMEKLKHCCPRGGLVQTWYGLCAKLLESRGEKIDYAQMQSDPNFWDRIQDRVVAGDIPEDWTFDTLIIDEGQDFQTEWVEILSLFGRGEPDILWLEDQDQGIRGKDPVELDGFVGYRASANYRSPESIARFIQKVVPFEFECANDLPGLGVTVHRYKDEEEQSKIVGQVIAELFRQGFRAQDLVILTLRGFGNSVLSGKQRVSNYTLNRFTGDYDLLGNQILTNGQVRFESIYRFKGQQAPAVVIVDAAQRDRTEASFLKLLYTAMTRATVKLDVVSLAEEEMTDRLIEASYP
jgi:superfamily I DNA and RNA helicase